MDTLIFTLHILLWPLCIVIVTLILLQGGAGDIASAFGGGGQLDSTLGVGASRKMAKLTGWLAAIFAVVVIFLAIPHKGSFKTASSEAAHVQALDAASGTAARSAAPSPSIVVPPTPSQPLLAPTLAPAPVSTPPGSAAAVPVSGPAVVGAPAPVAPKAVAPAAPAPGAALPAAPASATAPAAPAAVPANAPK